MELIERRRVTARAPVTHATGGLLAAPSQPGGAVVAAGPKSRRGAAWAASRCRVRMG